MFDRFSIGARLMLISLLPMLIMALTMLIIIKGEVGELVDLQVVNTKEALLEESQDELKNIIDVAYNTIKPIYDEGGSLEDAVALLKRMEFGEDGYIFGYDSNSKVYFKCILFTFNISCHKRIIFIKANFH